MDRRTQRFQIVYGIVVLSQQVSKAMVTEHPPICFIEAAVHMPSPQVPRTPL